MTFLRPHIYVAIAAFNRRDKTLACLQALHSQRGLGTEFEINVVLLDDASSDGTEQAVENNFPSVELLKGSGELFWGGGMHVAMHRAFEEQFDFILLLNDDVELRQNAIIIALKTYQEISKKRQQNIAVIGATVKPGTNQITYSGFMRTSRFNPSKIKRVSSISSEAFQCDTMNGNFVLLPKIVTDILGPIDDTFIHQLGDLDYGYRLNAIGGETWILPGVIGECAANHRKMPFEAEDLSVIQKWKKMNSPLGLPLKSWMAFMWRHGGAIGLVVLAAIYLKKLVK